MSARGGLGSPARSSVSDSHHFLDTAEGKAVSENAEAGHSTSSNPGDLRHEAAIGRIRHVHFDRRESHLGDRRPQRWMTGHITRRIDDGSVDAALVRGIKGFYDLAFYVRVKRLHLDTLIRCVRANL